MNLKTKIETILKALVAAALIAGILTGCGAKQIEIDTEELTAAKSDVTTAEETVEETRTEEPEEITEALPTDAESNADFLALFSNIAYYSYINHYNVVYNDETKNNLTFALENINAAFWDDDAFVCIWDHFEDQFDWPESLRRSVIEGSYYDEEEEKDIKAPDPLNRFGSASHYRCDGEKIDWILINFFNVKPDHSYDSEQHKSAKLNDRFNCYYRDGYYYFSDFSNGDALKLDIKIDSATKSSSGTYRFLLSGYEPNEGKKVFTYTVSAQKNQVEGKDVWKLLSLVEKPTDFTKTALETADFLDMFSKFASCRFIMDFKENSGQDDKTKLTYALFYINNNWGSLWSYCAERFNWPDSSFIYYGADDYNELTKKYVFAKPDPLNQFRQYYAYDRLDGDKVDWILINILNVKPDHSYNSKNYSLGEIDDGSDYYYHDGFYYYSDGDGGDAGPDIKLDSKTNKGGNEYVFKLSGTDPDTNKKAFTYTVTAQLNTVDGQKVWKLISFQQNKIQ